MRTRAGYFFYTMLYSKPPKSVDEQIALLQSRGLEVSDFSKARHYLSNISYYRLSAYLLPFQNFGDQSHKYKPGASFDKVIDLYFFDRELRLLIFDVLERIEIAFRCQIIYQYSISNGANWFEIPKHFYNQFHFENFLLQFQKELKLSNELFINHYKAKYTSPVYPPAWMSLEILSFGQLSKVYKNLKTSDEKKEIGKHFKIHYSVLESWMETLTYIRNICAHHSRLWNRTMVIKPMLPNKPQALWIDDLSFPKERLYLILVIIQYLLNEVNPTSSFRKELNDLFQRNPSIPLRALGFPLNWQNEAFWKL